MSAETKLMIATLAAITAIVAYVFSGEKPERTKRLKKETNRISGTGLHADRTLTVG